MYAPGAKLLTEDKRMRLGRLIAPVLMLIVLAGCAVEVGAPSEEIARARYSTTDDPYVAVVSMVSTRTGRARAYRAVHKCFRTGNLRSRRHVRASRDA